MADMVSADTHTQLSVCKVVTELAKKSDFSQKISNYLKAMFPARCCIS
jgi:hypothetical protein